MNRLQQTIEQMEYKVKPEERKKRDDFLRLYYIEPQKEISEEKEDDEKEP